MAEARIAKHEKEWPKAERLYRSLLTDYPGADPARQSNAHYRLGIIKEKMGDPPAAAAEYRAALALNPRHGPAAAALKKIQ